MRRIAAAIEFALSLATRPLPLATVRRPVCLALAIQYLKTVMSGQWRVTRMWHIEPHSGTQRISLATRHLSLATALKPLATAPKRIAAFVLFLSCSLISPLFAQEGNASLTGFIQDSSKALIPGVKVTAINTATNVRFEATTGKDGSYTIVSLPVGPYQIQLEKPGFKTILKDDVFLHTQDSLQVNFEMAVGSTAETITVTSNNATNDSPAVSMTVTREFVENMPLNGRSFQDLIALSPGTSTDSDGNPPGGFSVNGGRGDANYFTVDGVAANTGTGVTTNNWEGTSGVYPSQTAFGTTQSLLSIDALQEFRIQTSGYTADSGRQPGGHVELTSRSGTDDWHGTASDYLRNTAFDANNWFSNDFGVPRGAEHQNDFGGTLGGPVIIPRIYSGKDSTFFFFSYEGLRLLLPTFGEVNLPTREFRQSAGNGVQPFLNSFPIPNGSANNDGCTVDGTTSGPACDALFTTSFSNPSNMNAISMRLDHSLGERVQAFIRYAFTPTYSNTRVSPFSVVNSNNVRNQGITAGATARFTTELVNTARFNFSANSSYYGASLDSFGGAVPYSQSLLLLPQYLSPDNATSVTLSIAGINAGVNYGKTRGNLQQYNATDDLSWTKGQHLLKLGVDYRRLSSLTGSSPVSVNLYFFAMSSVQSGTADYLQQLASHTAQPVFQNLSLYAQDHWTLSKRLGLDLGVRWEFNPVPGASDGTYPLALTQASDLEQLALAPPGTPMYQNAYTNFAPRLGLVYNVMPRRRFATVIRAGTGLFYDTGQNLAAIGYGGFPFSNVSLSSGVPVPVPSSFLTPPSLPTTPYSTPYPTLFVGDPHLKLPYIEQWNLSLDQMIGTRNTLTVSYVGNQGHRLLFSEYYIGQGLNADFSNGVILSTNGAASNYNALQVVDQGRVLHGWQLLASYTWAHAIDDGSSDYDFTIGPVRGNSDNDVRQTLNIASNYEIPRVGSGRFANALSHGWLFANRFTAEAGYPVSVVQGYYTGGAAAVLLPIYPNLVGGQALYLHNVANVPGGWELNKDAFAPVAVSASGAPITQGDLPRNFVKGPGFWNLNSSMARDFPIRENTKIQFRVDAFNLLNHPNFTNVDGYLPDSTFGQVAVFKGAAAATLGTPNALYGTGAARSLQLMLKLQF